MLITISVNLFSVIINYIIRKRLLRSIKQLDNFMYFWNYLNKQIV